MEGIRIFRYFLACLIVMGGLSLYVNPVRASYWSDNFNDDILDWTISSGTWSNAVSSPDFDGSKYLITGTNNAIITKTGLFPSKFFSAWIKTSGNARQNGGCYQLSYRVSNVFFIQNSTTSTGLSFTISSTCGAGSLKVTGIGMSFTEFALSKDTWYRFDARYLNTNSGTTINIKVYDTGLNLIQDFSTSLSQTVTNPDRISINAYKYSGYLYFDNPISGMENVVLSSYDVSAYGSGSVTFDKTAYDLYGQSTVTTTLTTPDFTNFNYWITLWRPVGEDSYVEGSQVKERADLMVSNSLVYNANMNYNGSWLAELIITDIAKDTDVYWTNDTASVTHASDVTLAWTTDEAGVYSTSTGSIGSTRYLQFSSLNPDTVNFEYNISFKYPNESSIYNVSIGEITNGYIPFVLEVPVGTWNFSFTSKNLTDNVSSSLIHIHLVVTAQVLSTTSIISGYVRDNASNLLTGALVTATLGGSKSSTTNALGYYQITYLPNGNYTVTASKNGYTSQILTLNITKPSIITGFNFALNCSGTCVVVTPTPTPSPTLPPTPPPPTPNSEISEWFLLDLFIWLICIAGMFIISFKDRS